MQLALTLDYAPRGLKKDGAQRSVIALDRLIVLVIDDNLHLACLSDRDLQGDGVIFTIPCSPRTRALEQMILGG